MNELVAGDYVYAQGIGYGVVMNGTPGDPLIEWMTEKGQVLVSEMKSIKKVLDNGKEKETYPPQMTEATRLSEDMVNHPPHYTKGKIECINYIKDQGFNYSEGQVIKYVTRYRWKGTPIEDLQKAKWYLELLIKGVEDGTR